MARILKRMYDIRERVTFWAVKTETKDYADEDESETEEELQKEGEEYEFEEEGNGMRTERILRAILKIPIRWFQMHYHARRIERNMNKDHPECPVRIRVIDSLVGNPIIENLFDKGLIIVPCLFLLSFIFWAASRFVAQNILETTSFIMIIISLVTFVLFGLVFVFCAFFGYEFEYIDGRQFPRRKRNPLDSYHKFA